MAFSIFGKSKKQKFGNIIGLIILGIFVLSKTNFIKFDVEHIHKESVSISDVKFQNKDELLSAISSYQVNMNGIENEGKKLGVLVNDFQNSVTMNIVIPKDDPSPKEVTLEFDSNIKDKDLTPIYKYIAADMKQFLEHQ